MTRYRLKESIGRYETGDIFPEGHGLEFSAVFPEDHRGLFEKVEEKNDLEVVLHCVKKIRMDDANQGIWTCHETNRKIAEMFIRYGLDVDRIREELQL